MRSSSQLTTGQSEAGQGERARASRQRRSLLSPDDAKRQRYRTQRSDVRQAEAAIEALATMRQPKNMRTVEDPRIVMAA